MSYVIAIPTHARATSIHKKTLKLLSVFPKSIIHIFIEPSEMASYDLSGYIVCPGRPGTAGQRAAIEEYFPQDTRVLCLDDDVSAIKTLVPMELPGLFERCFDVAAKEGCLLWGISPTDNGLSMRDSATVGLSYIIGSCFGFTVKHKIEYDSNLTEDFERTVQHYSRFKSPVIRFNGIGPRTKYFASGGLEEFRKGTAQEDAARTFHAKYPQFCRLRIREGKPADVVIKTIALKRITSPFALHAEDFALLLDELQRRPISLNKYRNVAGDGRSQAFGAVGRRCLSPDYSRNCWQRPYLYKLLLDFGQKHVKIPFTSITVNDNYKAAPHRDRGNIGESYLIGFGDYSGGELQIHEGDLSGCHNVRHRPLVTDFSKVLHSVQPWEGQRYSLVYYTSKNSSQLPTPSVRSVDGKWKFFRGEELCTGLAHPLKGRTKPS